MTIIAGFRCHDGIVICGDTQETVSNISKRNVPKVRVEPMIWDDPDTVPGLVAGFCGAGHGPFIDMLTTKAWRAVEKDAVNLDDACERIDAVIKAVYHEYGQIYQSGQCPEVELIYGVKMGGRSRLFSATGPIVNEVERYKSAGAGYYMADFLASRMSPHGLDVYQSAILAAYILFQAKEHVDGCGGESHVAVLRHEGKSGRIDQTRIDIWTKLLDQIDSRTRRMIIEAADIREDSGINEAFSGLETTLSTVRQRAIDRTGPHF